MARVLRVGVVARPHGLAGELVVTLDHAASDSLLHARTVRLGDGAPRTIRRARPGRRGQAIVDLGLGGPEDVEPLRGLPVLVDAAELPELAAHEYWQADLLGLSVVDPEGRELGRVEEIVDTADVAVLVVRGQDGERYVPFADPYVVEVDLEGGRVKVAPPTE